MGLLTLDIARGRLTRGKADEVVKTLIGASVTLVGKRVETRDGWDSLVPVVTSPQADWETFQQMESTPPCTISSGLSSPVDTRGSSPRASDDSRAPKDADEDRGSLGSLHSYQDDDDTPARTLRYPSPVTPAEIETPEKLLHDALFQQISGLQKPLNPNYIPEERLLRGFSAGPSSEIPDTIPDTLPWQPILASKVNTPMQGPKAHGLGTHSIFSNQSGPFVSPDMSRPIGGSSARYPEQAAEPNEEEIPDPMTPPGCGEGQNRSRSPLPRRARIARSPQSPRDDGVQLVEVRTQFTTEVFELHYTQPLQMVKLLMAYPDPMQMTKLSYKHIKLASHSRVEGLDDPAWLALEYHTGNSVVCHSHWVLERSKILKAGRNPFHSRCRLYNGPITQEQTTSFLRCKRSTDLVYMLPCGRVGTLDFGGRKRTLSWAQDQIMDRYEGQFHGETPRLQTLCGCGLHFTQLRIHAELNPGQDTCVMAMTGAWNKTPPLVPELFYQDKIIPRPEPEVVPKGAKKNADEVAQAKPKAVQQKRMPRPVKQPQQAKGSVGPALRPKSAAPAPPVAEGTGETRKEEAKETPVPVRRTRDESLERAPPGHLQQACGRHRGHNKGGGRPPRGPVDRR